MILNRRPLILASASSARRSMLEAVGLKFRVVQPPLDEAALKAEIMDLPPADLAAVLAAAKAEAASRLHAGTLVIGADQVLELDGELFSKPASLAAARLQLRRLRGKTHRLHSAFALAEDGATIARGYASASLTMRSFSDEFLHRYLGLVGNSVSSTVGAYQIEGFGLQLFSAIDGEHTTILGMPMLPLLEELRLNHAITA